MGDLFEWLQASAERFKTLPLVLPVLFVAVLAAMAYWKRAFPFMPLVIVMLAPAMLSIGLLFRPDLFLLIGTADVVILLVAVADLMSLPAERSFSAERKTMRIASLQKRHPVSMTVSNHSRRTWNVWIRDDVPQEFTATP